MVLRLEAFNCALKLRICNFGAKKMWEAIALFSVQLCEGLRKASAPSQLHGSSVKWLGLKAGSRKMMRRCDGERAIYSVQRCSDAALNDLPKLHVRKRRSEGLG